MDIKIERTPRLVKVVLVGRLVAAGSEELRDRLDEWLEDCPNVLCDLSQMTHVDSSGLGVLVRILQKCKALGGTCRLACLQAHPRIVFDITKVYRVFEIYETVEEAERAFD